MTEARDQKSEVSKTLALRPLLLALSFSGAMLFALCFSAEAQQAKKVPRIGYLNAASPSVTASRTEAFRQGLRELGYVEGKTLSLNGDLQRA